MWMQTSRKHASNPNLTPLAQLFDEACANFGCRSADFRKYGHDGPPNGQLTAQNYAFIDDQTITMCGA
eukprot:1338549-Karenia_brevis.AAC.1